MSRGQRGIAYLGPTDSLADKAEGTVWLLAQPAGAPPSGLPVIAVTPTPTATYYRVIAPPDRTRCLAGRAHCRRRLCGLMHTSQAPAATMQPGSASPFPVWLLDAQPGQTLYQPEPSAPTLLSHTPDCGMPGCASILQW